MKKIFLVFLIYLLTPSCSLFVECNPIDRKFKMVCKNNNLNYSILLSDVTDFDWDFFYIIVGPRFPSEVEEIIGMNYDKLIDDNSSNYFFVKDNKIVKEYISRCGDISLDLNLTNEQGFAKFHKNQLIYIKKNEIDGITSYRITNQLATKK